MRFVLGLGAPLLVAVAWAAFGSPKAAVQLPLAGKLLFELVVFGLAVAALAAAGRPGLAWTFGIVVVANRLLMLAWRQ